jgi:hypothetical protein
VKNAAPVARADTGYETDKNVNLWISDPTEGVLHNDSDPDGDELTAILVDSTNHGKLAFLTDGTFFYEPDAGFSGVDSFRYKASDGEADSNVITVSISVNNHAPLAREDSYETVMNTDYVASLEKDCVLYNDHDIDGDKLEARLFSPTSHGVLALELDGSFTYSPDEDYVGKDIFRYRAFDGDDYSEPVEVTIEVLEPKTFTVYVPMITHRIIPYASLTNTSIASR